jgi:5-methylthioadenosine/S-adenosylhomocysteine deaminase
MDIAIINTWLITFEGKGLGIKKNGALGIEDDQITYVGETSHLDYKKADFIIDGKGTHLTMPGLINSHTHSILTLCRGTAHDLPEIEYIPKGLSIFANHLTPEDVMLGAKIAVLEGLRAGTTTFTEYGFSLSNLVKNVYIPFNARVVATEMITELSFSDEKKPNELYEYHHYLGKNALRRANRLYKSFNESDLVNVMYGPNALDMISMELLQDVKDIAIENNTKIHMHIAQGGRERIQIKNRYGNNMTAVKLLKKQNLLDSDLIAAHIHDTNEVERAILVKNDVRMVGCPSSISKIDGIVPPLGNYIQLGGKAAIGTDEAPGTGHHNLFNEIKMASILTKVIQNDPTALPPWESLKLGTIGGAEVLGLENKIGSLKVGKKADIITLDLQKLHLTPIISKPFNNIIGNIVYSTKGNEIDNVIINGKPIILDDKVLNIDEEEMIKKANERAQILFEKVTEDWIKADSKMVEYHNKGFI